MPSARLLGSGPVALVLVLLAAACGGGGPSRDEFVEAANTVCNESNEDTEGLDPPESLEDAVAYADDAKEIVADRILELDDLEVPGDEEEALAGYLDGLEEQRDALIELADADPAADEDAVRNLVEEVRSLEEDNQELADDLDLSDCADATEGETVALALEVGDEPEPTDDTLPPVDDAGGDEPIGGELGDEPIAVVAGLGLPEGATYSGETQEIVDDSGTLRMTVPVEWSDVDGSPSEDGSLNLDATTDIDAFTAGFTVPGVLFAATGGTVDIDDLLGRFTPQACTPIGQGDYSDGVYTGRFQVAVDCGGTPTAVVVVSAQADDGTHGVLVQIGVTSAQDIGPAEQVLDTFLAESGGF